MPRVIFNEYLEQRAFLRLAWEHFDQLYSLLDTHQQWDLHAYYQPLLDYDDEWLKTHRAHISKKRPELPAKAGKHYAKLHRVYETSIQAAKATLYKHPRSRARQRQSLATAGPRRITVRAVARPEPDLHLLSQTLISLA
jgi:hypothetical protein